MHGRGRLRPSGEAGGRGQEDVGAVADGRGREGAAMARQEAGDRWWDPWRRAVREEGDGWRAVVSGRHVRVVEGSDKGQGGARVQGNNKANGG